jgi:hypothetical protein
MRSGLALCLVTLSTLGCAPEGADLTSSPLITGLDRELEVTQVARLAGREPLPPYMGANFDFRLELGLSSPDCPEISVFPARVLAAIDDDWIGLPPQGWDDPVPVRYGDGSRWAAIWLGSLPPGELHQLVIDLAEDVHVVVEDVAYDAAMADDDRQMQLELELDTDHPAPVVVTVFLETWARDGVVNYDVDKVLLREVDDRGYAKDYRPVPDES